MIRVLNTRDYLILLITNKNHKTQLLSCVRKLCSNGHPRYTSTNVHITHTVFLFSIFIFFIFMWKTEKKTNKNKLNKSMHKTRCKCMRRKEERKRSIHGDDTDVLTKEFKTFVVKRFGKQISLLIISVNKLKSESTIHYKKKAY